jgi:hypothetical protein
MTLFDDIRELEQSLKAVQKLLEDHGRRIERQEERIGGERGLSASLTALTDELRAFREMVSNEFKSISGEFKKIWKAGYVIAVLLIGASITFAFGVLALIG